jgi:23S rRNA (pseudouridine1915-N3)-methyltransferase
MRLIIAAVGRLKGGGERVLFEKYRDRCEGAGKRLGIAPIAWHEIGESRAELAAKRRAEEGAALMKLVRAAEVVIALDETGRMLTSLAFARLIGRLRDDGTKTMALVIGGADGLARDVVGAAHFTLSFGAITLPHQLARVVLAEQLYRAATILSGHPYHRD